MSRAATEYRYEKLRFLCRFEMHVGAGNEVQPHLVVPEFQQHEGPLSQHRHKSAAEKGRKQAQLGNGSNSQAVPDFCKTVTVHYNESRKRPQALSERIDRAAAAAEARLDPVAAAAVRGVM